MHKIRALANLTGDQHDFIITKQDTAVFTIYERRPADLSFFGAAKDGWIWDCLFQEINIETHQLIFSWRASDHFHFRDICSPWDLLAGTFENPFDYYHLNSVDKDRWGNYIVSARYTHAISCIDGKTGAVLWNLGGKNNSFLDLSGGNATDFAWQHDARWRNDYTAISIFDNRAYFGDDSHPARGMLVQLDKTAMTVKLIAEYRHPAVYVAESQGSMQMLENGNVFLGYGNAPVFAEFSPDGQVVCDIAFSPLHFENNGRLNTGVAMSYKTYKQRWIGYPAENPKVKFWYGLFYVSWNGATEVRWWRLEGSNAARGKGRQRDLKEIATFEKTGFESNCSVMTGPTEESAHLAFKLTALDASNHTLGAWDVGTDGIVEVSKVRL